ncbi:TVP38/TMEM64 family protein [Geodermatophilus sp. URMC 63]
MRAAVLLAVLAAAVVAVLVVDLPSAAAVRSWLDGTGPLGVVLLVLGAALALVGPVPRTALSLLLGAVVGFWTGLVVAVAGGVFGGLAAFGLSRALGRDAVTRLAGRRLAAVDRRLGDGGFVAVLLVRLSPLSFTLTSYAAGLTGIRLVPYALGTALGIVPGSVLQVGVGASAGWLSGWATSTGGLLVEGALMLAVFVGGVSWWWWRRRSAAGTRPGRTRDVPCVDPNS